MVLTIATVPTKRFTKDGIKSTCQKFSFLDCARGLEEDGTAACFAHVTAYYWNNELQKCVQGLYGGCRPSPNNFHDLGTCERKGRKYCLKNECS